MESIKLEAKAKINLSLDILRRRPDGYHDLQMVMQSIALCDDVILTKTKSGISVDSDSGQIPNNSTNTAYRAAKLLFDNFKISGGIRIFIIKRIPVAAGLAGGSADAAAVIKGMNRMFKLNLDIAAKQTLGIKIGADVPYCILGGTALAEGVGDVLTRLRQIESIPIILIKPDISVSTAWVYSNYRVENSLIRPDTEVILKYIEEGCIEKLASCMRNVLETVTVRKYAQIEEIKTRMRQQNALGAMMSGSGSTVFGIFADEEQAQKAYKELKSQELGRCILTRTCN